MKFAAAPALLTAVVCAFTAGCGDPNAFDEDVAKTAAAERPFQLDSEQVSMRENQLNCAVNNDLWDAPSSLGGASNSSGVSSERFVSRLQQKGRDLNFTDDATSGDPEFGSPYTQVRGKFPMQLVRVVSIQNGDNKATKIVQAKVGITITHTCFDSPLLIMGIRKGKYSDDLPVTLQFEQDENGWHLSKLIH